MVEIECYPHNFFGIKFYWKGVADSKRRYSLLTGDFEPRNIVRSCIEIMLEYYRRIPSASFAFVGANEDGESKGQPSKRFKFYRRMMMSVFPQEWFLHASVEAHSLYLLINQAELTSGHISIPMVEEMLNSLFEGEFSINAR